MARLDLGWIRRARWIAVVGGLAVVVLILAALFGTILAKLLPPSLPHVPIPAPSPVDGAGLLVGGAFLLFLLLTPFYLIGLGLVLCCCLKGMAGMPSLPPLPGLPDMTKLAAILRTAASELDRLAITIDTANTVVNDARQKLTNDFLSMNKPAVRTHDQTFNTLLGDVTVTVLDGIDWVPVFDDAAKAKLRTLNDLIDDVTGQPVLSEASRALRDQAVLLRQQASALDGQPA